MNPLQFTAFPLRQELLDACAQAGFIEPTPVQSQAIPVMLAGQDVLVQAQTGTGKTVAFALPMLQRIDPLQTVTQALVLAPTRELATQVAEDCRQLACHCSGLTVATIYGGQDYSQQLKALKKGPQLVVGTPGRLMDHMRRGTLSLANVQCVVLDEADEMLTMGFIEDIEWILQHIPEARQTALFSATVPSAIRAIAQQYCDQPQSITVQSSSAQPTQIRQLSFQCKQRQKSDVVAQFLEFEPMDACIIFVRTKQGTDELAHVLQGRGFKAVALNGDMAQSLREQVLQKIKSHKIDVIVATDVAARGLDVERITHVINYDVPTSPETYTHRIGRTGRAGRSGTALLLAAPHELRLCRLIERAVGEGLKAYTPPSIESLRQQRADQLALKIQAFSGRRQYTSQQMLTAIAKQTGMSFESIALSLITMEQEGKPIMVIEANEAAAQDAVPRGRRRQGRRRGQSERAGGDRRRSGQQSERVGGDRRRSGQQSERAGSDRRRSGQQSERVGGDRRRSGQQSERVGGDRRRSGQQSERVGGDRRRSGQQSERAGGDRRRSGQQSERAGGDRRRSRQRVHPSGERRRSAST